MQVAFGSDFRSWFPERTKEGLDVEAELLGLLNQTLEGVEYSFYYLFFEVSVIVCCRDPGYLILVLFLYSVSSPVQNPLLPYGSTGHPQDW